MSEVEILKEQVKALEKLVELKQQVINQLNSRPYYYPYYNYQYPYNYPNYITTQTTPNGIGGAGGTVTITGGSGFTSLVSGTDQGSNISTSGFVQQLEQNQINQLQQNGNYAGQIQGTLTQQGANQCLSLASSNGV